MFFEDFVLRAILGGAGVALVAGPLGCFVVWRRMAYFGDSLAHGALLGVALGTALEINLNVGMLAVFVLFALLLVQLQSRQRLATDTLLGILSHAALSLMKAAYPSRSSTALSSQPSAVSRSSSSKYASATFDEGAKPLPSSCFLAASASNSSAESRFPASASAWAK